MTPAQTQANRDSVGVGFSLTAKLKPYSRLAPQRLHGGSFDRWSRRMSLLEVWLSPVQIKVGPCCSHHTPLPGR